MKSLLKNMPVRLLLLLVTAMIFNMPLIAAQQKQTDTSTAKKTSAKPKRVLYGLASFYASKFNGRQTASGEIFNQKKLTCACNVLPLGTWIRVTNLHNGRSVVVKTNDRLHPKMRRIVDLTRAAAIQLGYIGRGLTRVKVEVLGKKPPASE